MYYFGESGGAFSKIVVIRQYDYYAVYVATMSQGGDRAGNPII